MEGGRTGVGVGAVEPVTEPAVLLGLLAAPMLKPSPDIEAFELKKLAAVASGFTATGWTGIGCTTSAGTTGVGWTGATGSVGAISSFCEGAAAGST